MIRRWAIPVCTLMTVVATSSSAVHASTPGSHRSGSIFWGDPTQSKVDATYAALQAVSAVSANDVWAVGFAETSGRVTTLARHWNGTSWSSVPSPNPIGARVSILNGVDALSADNVWAVGLWQRGSSPLSRTLIEHWNGTEWRRVPSPNPSLGGFGNRLSSVSATSASDVWAVGYDDVPGPAGVHTMALHWDGSGWSEVRTPIQPGADRGFFGVGATTASSAWAVGVTFDRQTGRSKSLVEHWNGARWNKAPIASPGAGTNILRSVSLVAPGNVWAVGESGGSLGGSSTPLVEHRTGGTWHQVRPPGLGRAGSLTSVSGAGPEDVWMVGVVGGANVLEHWDGHLWSRFHGVGPFAGSLQGVTSGGATATWAVGSRGHGATVVPFEERWNGHLWTR